jgi:uncharacterized damage-inducible protein DinB
MDESGDAMTNQQLAARCDYFGMVHGVTVRAISAFSDDELGFRPAAGMRSPRELIFHIYAQEKLLAEGARAGRLTMEALGASSPEVDPGRRESDELKTVADLRAFAEACHRALDATFRAMSDEDVARIIESPLGNYPAWQFFAFAYDEHWHHRGQLYTYLRLLGKEPPMLYDYQP